jgi:hypothetical protein
LANLAADFD